MDKIRIFTIAILTFILTSCVSVHTMDHGVVLSHQLVSVDKSGSGAKVGAVSGALIGAGMMAVFTKLTTQTFVNPWGMPGINSGEIITSLLVSGGIIGGAAGATIGHLTEKPRTLYAYQVQPDNATAQMTISQVDIVPIAQGTRVAIQLKGHQLSLVAIGR